MFGLNLVFLMFSGTISADVGNNIRGFLIQAVDPSGDRIGSFTTGSGQRFLDCSSINSVPASVSEFIN